LKFLEERYPQKRVGQMADLLVAIKKAVEKAQATSRYRSIGNSSLIMPALNLNDFILLLLKNNQFVEH